jgi:thioesterase domain-containing protein/acyl carrier protein
MEPVLAPFAARLRQVALAPPRIPFLSNLTGTWATAAEATDPEYWVRHLRQTVRFAAGLGEVLALPAPVLLEVGPGRALTTLARQHPARAAARLISPSLGPASDPGSDLEHALGALGRAWLAAVPLDWAGFHAHERRRRVPLPSYPFERRRFWLDGLAAPAGSSASAGSEFAPSAALSSSSGGAAPQPGEAAGETDPLAGPFVPPAGDDEQAVAEVFRDMLGLERVSREEDFFTAGGSSLMALQLTSRLRRRLGVELPSSALLEASTVSALAALARELRTAAAPAAPAAGEQGAGGAAPASRRPPASCLVRLQAGAPGRRPLFLVHQVGGNVYTFRPLARALGAEFALQGLRSLGLEEGETALDRIEKMAEHYLGLVRAAQPQGPYRIGGASMGGMVAFEMARQLREAGAQIELLTLFDTPCGDQMAPPPRRDSEIVAAVFAGRVELRAEELDPLGLEEQLAFALAKAERAGGLSDGFDLAQARRLESVLRGNIGALHSYAPRPYEGRLLYFRAAVRRPFDPPRPEIPWIELARGGIEIQIVPGDHQTMHDAPHVATAAERLRALLR